MCRLYVIASSGKARRDEGAIERGKVDYIRSFETGEEFQGPRNGSDGIR
jgi:hypothetical protein